MARRPVKRARLSLGTAQLGMAYGINNAEGRLAESDAFAILDRAFEHGIDAIDTAPAYGDAEVRIGKYFEAHGRPDGVRVTTKVRASTVDEVARSVRTSRERLGQLDDVLFHRSDDLALPGVLEAADVAWGVSIYDPAESKIATERGLSAVQLPFNAFDQRHRAAIRSLKAAGITVYVRSALLQGLLVMDEAPRNVPAAAPYLEKFRAIARETGRSCASLAIGYAAWASGADYVVAGVESVTQLDQLVAAVETPVEDTVIGRIEANLHDVPVDVVDPRRWEVT